ncbi:anhydro-N-acetylmuramic acid kinase [Microcoleus sp. FACHB-SPT15]|uniref:anhydro-N-acetylmuramic acid kinase n=1 Tax=Microcoleus sp. FACHB-SPT15 TaxID=2692830 RepID=UPI001786C338|nr:anhydro-N-acetylmuramic acid kinase [Microcoleus sp. FACHB-SPT15]MBD1807061.1 anhydro-N-acetylmuramic acid kinase [Microcoleus sp. FACHB-SPT15]
MTRVIGLISGTSVDGIDAALVEISGTDINLQVELVAGETYPYPDSLREQILAVCAGASLSMAELAELDDAIAFQFAQAAQEIQGNSPSASLIGSHGQTVYHRPPVKQGSQQTLEEPLPTSPSSHLPITQLGYTLQLGRGEVIAQLTGIKTISNFRVADIAAKGQGAPLVSRVDAYLLSSPTQHRCIQNIGGIGNLTYLPARQGNWLEAICGWDTGPGNALLDLAVQHFSHGSQTYDQDGNWARQGTPCQALVEQWLSEDFFHLSPPKSTGRELFGVDYLNRCLAESTAYHLSPADTLATLTELTASSIVHSYHNFLPKMPDEVLLCGGGGRNLYLKQRLQALMESVQVRTTDEAGVSGDFKEAIAFAVLAYWRSLGIPGNLPQVTGAAAAVPLGNVYAPIES